MGTFKRKCDRMSVQRVRTLRGANHTLSRALTGAPADKSAATILQRPSFAATCRPVVRGSVSSTYPSETACHAYEEREEEEEEEEELLLIGYCRGTQGALYANQPRCAGVTRAHMNRPQGGGKA